MHQRPNFEQWNNTGNHALFLNSLVEKGQYASRKDKNAEEYEFEKQYDQCTLAPKINDLENGCVWRETQNEPVRGTDKFLERAKKGREQHQTRKAAKDDRFGIVKQTKTGKKKAVRQDVNKMSVSLAGQKSKFKSCFGEVQDLPG